jgi:hypothetical protein
MVKNVTNALMVKVIVTDIHKLANFLQLLYHELCIFK